MFFFFFFNDTATTEIYTLSLHDALPISAVAAPQASKTAAPRDPELIDAQAYQKLLEQNRGKPLLVNRSEEHTSELQSRLHLVCRLLLEKKKKEENRV